MMTLLRSAALSLVLLASLAATVPAQWYGDDHAVHAGASAPATHSFQKALAVPFGGRAWIAANAADQGLGYEGNYYTVGVLAPFCADSFCGTWFVEGRGHSTDDGDFFGNIGIGRRWEENGHLIGLSFWYDYDDDAFENFGHDFHQLGVSFEHLCECFDFRINGYFPIANAEHTIGSEDNCFIGNRLLIQHGIDAALAGVDSEIGVRLPFKGADFYNTKLYGGGYLYGSDSVDTFGGFSVRLQFDPIDRVTVQFQGNHDDTFDTTGFIRVVFTPFSRGSCQGQDLLQPTQRNDHIVRFHQDAIFATDPDTGNLYTVFHVDDDAADGGDGSFERPFNNLEDAEMNDTPQSIVFVREGAYETDNDGYSLEQGQFFLGDGVAHVIPTVEDPNFLLCSDLDGNRPFVNNPGSTVLIANDDTEIAGFVIGTTTNVDRPVTGIQGTDISDTGADADDVAITIRDNFITRSLGGGIELNGGTDGTVNILDNNITRNDGTAAFVESAGTDSVVNVEGNTIDSNGAGVSLLVSGGGSMLASVSDNPFITNNDGNAVEITGTGTNTELQFNVDRNPFMDRNGGVAVLVTLSDDAQMVNTSTISDNGMRNNDGIAAQEVAGIFLNVSGAATNVNRLDIEDNLISGSPLDDRGGARFNFDVGNTTTNEVNFNDNDVLNTLGRGLVIDITQDTHLRFTMEDNEIANHEETGLLGETSSDDARLSLIARRNVINNIFGDGTEDNGVGTGVELRSFNNSRLFSLFENNQITNAEDFGVRTSTDDNTNDANRGGQVLAWANNTVTGHGDRTFQTADDFSSSFFISDVNDFRNSNTNGAMDDPDFQAQILDDDALICDTFIRTLADEIVLTNNTAGVAALRYGESPSGFHNITEDEAAANRVQNVGPATCDTEAQNFIDFDAANYTDFFNSVP